MTHKILDLFSGLGGFSLGLERTGHFKTIAFCDNDKFSKLILDKHWKGVKIYDDVREITKEKFKEDGIPFPDIITGGFPCQPFSVAGKQKGTSDDRHLWPEMFRIIKAFKPRYVIGENVRGIINIQDGVVFETVCTDLESEGYEVQPFIIPAAGVGAPHRRERVWIIAVRSDVANTFCDDEGREISRGDEETRGIQEEHRTEHSTTRKSSRTSKVRKGDDGYESLENTRRTLRSRSELGAADEDETREGNADQSQRSSSTSRSNVADTERKGLEGLSKHSATIGGQDTGTHTRNEGSSSSNRKTGNATHTKRERLQGRQRNDQGEGRQILPSEQHDRGEIRSKARRFSGVSGQKEGSQNWWLVEPNVGRVAHGVSGRVHRLKGLGNSIVPQIAEEIGKALIKAEHEME
jgi:DNA (cytosine-5)-methyltransferase 1